MGAPFRDDLSLSIRSSSWKRQGPGKASGLRCLGWPLLPGAKPRLSCVAPRDSHGVQALTVCSKTPYFRRRLPLAGMANLPSGSI